jgi:hypothetical protein
MTITALFIAAISQVVLAAAIEPATTSYCAQVIKDEQIKLVSY